MKGKIGLGIALMLVLCWMVIAIEQSISPEGVDDTSDNVKILLLASMSSQEVSRSQFYGVDSLEIQAAMTFDVLLLVAEVTLAICLGVGILWWIFGLLRGG